MLNNILAIAYLVIVLFQLLVDQDTRDGGGHELLADGLGRCRDLDFCYYFISAKKWYSEPVTLVEVRLLRAELELEKLIWLHMVVTV